MNKALIGGGAILSSVLNFLSILYWARVLSPADYGRYALIASWGLLLNGVLFEWLRQTLSRNIFDARRVYRSESISPIVCLYSLTSAMLALLCLFTSWIPNNPSHLVLWIVLYGISEGIFTIAVTLHTIYARAIRYFLSVVGRGSATPVVSYFLLESMSDKGLAVALAALLTSSAIAGVNLVVEPALGHIKMKELTRKNMGATVRFGIPLSLSASTNAISGQVDRILVGALLGSSVLGVYAVICDVAQKPISVLMTAINTVAYPYYLRATELTGLRAGFDRLNQSGSYLIAATFGVPIICSLFGDRVLEAFYAKEVPNYAATIFGIAAATSLLRGLLGAFFYPAFQLARRTTAIMRISISLMLVSLTVTGVGGLLFGVYGAASGALAGAALGVSVAQLMARRLGNATLCTKQNAVYALAHIIWLPVYLIFPGHIDPWWITPLLYSLISYVCVAVIVLRGPGALRAGR